MPEFTPNQLAALQPGGKLVLAGAGSGKTTVLTERYVKLLASDEFQPRDIVAMTFSRKAAANLQAKIHAALMERQRNDPEHAEHWQKQRERMPWARIGTIHSICAGLLRSFPLEAEVDPEFVLGERADERVEAFQQRLRDLAWKRDPNLANLLEVLGEQKKVEQLGLLLLNRPDVVKALQEAERAPEEAVEFFDRLYLDGYARIRGDGGGPSTDAHRNLVNALPLLLRIVEPLLPGDGESSVELTFDDIEFHTLRLLKKGGEASRRIRSSIKQLLVDEFQDTSTRQWQMIRALVAKDCGDTDLERLFLVGDDKQSIYGFRAADVTVVESARQLFLTSNKPEREWFVRLDDNFRTLREVLEPLNGVFQNLLPDSRENALPFEAIAGPLNARRNTPREVEPVVEINLGVDESPESVFDQLAKRLKQDVGSVMIVDPEDPDGKRCRLLRPEDVGVLLRTRTHLGLLENALKKANIRHRISGGRGFLKRQEVLDLVHLLTALSDPRDQLALVGVMRSPILSLSDAAVSAVMLAAPSPLEGWRLLAEGHSIVRTWTNSLAEDDLRSLKRGWRLWSEWSAFSEHRTPAETLLDALEACGAWAAYAVGEDGDQRIANLYQFLERVRSFADEGYFTLRRLVERIRAEIEAPGEESEKEAETDAEGGVAVMTIHAAKGLEFPYVILPDLATGSKSRGMRELSRGHLMAGEHPLAALAEPRLAILAEKMTDENENDLFHAMHRHFAPAEENAERLRLMYVAATRARDHLLLYSHVKVKSTKAKGRQVDLPAESHLGSWLKALDVTLNPEGIESAPEIPLLPVVMLSSNPRSDSGDSAEVHGHGAVPSLSLHAAPGPDRWTLPFTAFTGWLANPSDEETLRLVWFAGDPREVEALGEENVVTMGREEARLVGDLVHHLYQVLGPGCSWERAQDTVEDELQRLVVQGDARERLRGRIRELLAGGESLALGAVPKNARREFSLRLRLNHLILRGQADLVWREGDTVHVLDYKTNRMNGAQSPTQVAESHGYDHQARLYGLTLLKAWGLRKAVCEVAFLDGGDKVVYHVTPDDEAGYRLQVDRLVHRWKEVSEKARTNAALGEPS